MHEDEPFRRLKLRDIASRMAPTLGIAFFAACGAQSEAPVATTDGSKNPELIGGEPARADQFRATVGINDGLHRCQGRSSTISDCRALCLRGAPGSRHAAARELSAKRRLA